MRWAACCDHNGAMTRRRKSCGKLALEPGHSSARFKLASALFDCGQFRDAEPSFGETFASRVSASILTAAGLSELIADLIAQYRALALQLATDRETLARTKAKVALCRDSPLSDTRVFTRGLEKAFVAIWDRHKAGLLPNHIAIE